ncbi:SHOCT domain-containing protein [Methanoregula sp.]|uniref:SHOCT domain-containing protein n=1 Tax=Methanoregula sp. TaxID=2052170 RepID=UPI0035618013
MKINEIVQSIKKDANTQQGESADQILLETSPEKRSFIFKYILAFTPCILVFVSIIIRYLLDIIISTFSTAVSSTMGDVTGSGSSINDLLLLNGTLASQGATSTLFPGSMNGISSALSYGTNISVLMIAPVGIFIIVAAIGWSLRIAEMWTGVALTLTLSGAVGLLLVIATGTGVVQDKFLLYLQWIAFLVQPFSIIATIIALAWLEKFRKSIHYTITGAGVSFRGGIWKKQEHLLPHSQIGMVVLKQNFFGSRYNFGTVIPVSSMRWGEETSLRGIGAAGQKDNFGGGIMFAKGREEASQSPLDCLYGIPDPKTAQKILTEFSSRQALHEAEQVSYLKKIYEQGIAGPMTGGSGVPYKVPSVVTRFPVNDENMAEPPGRTDADDKVSEDQKTAIIRVNDPDTLKTTTDPLRNTIREIPPVKQPKSAPVQAIPPVESIPELIQKLAELRDAGIITEQEFDAKKAELLKRI